MLTYLKKLTSERDNLTGTATSITDKAAAEERDLTDTERTSLASMATRCAEIDAQLTTYGAQLDSERAYATLRSRFSDDDDDKHGPPARVQARAPEPRGWGALFVASDAFKSYKGRGSSDEVALPGLFTRQDDGPETPTFIGDWAGYMPPYQHTPLPWSLSTPLLDSFGQITTSSNSVDWYEYPAEYPLAEVVAEGAVKPEAKLEITPHTDSLDTYAHWHAISRQALEDIPQIRTIVERMLRGGVLAALEAAAVAALTGASLANVTNADLLAGIRIAVARVQAAGFTQPNAVLLNPDDFAGLDLEVMQTAGTAPNRLGSFWGMRAVAVPTVAAGTAYVGDFSNAVTLFSRSTASVYLTDSHADLFIRNILVILAEQRALLAVTNPGAAVEVTTGNGNGTRQAPAPAAQPTPAA